MKLVIYLRYHLFSLLQRRTGIAKTFSLPHLFLLVWNQEGKQILPFHLGISPLLCLHGMTFKQPSIFDHQVLHYHDQVIGVLASRNSIMLMGIETLMRVSQSYPLKPTGWLITRGRKVARAVTVFHFSAIFSSCSPKNDFMWNHSRFKNSVCMVVPLSLSKENGKKCNT